MTKHAPLHTHRHFPPRGARRISKSHSRSRYINDQLYTNTVSSSNSSQGVATYCTIDGPGPPSSCCRGNADVALTRCCHTQDALGRISATCHRPPVQIVTRNNTNYPIRENYSSVPNCFSNANYATVYQDIPLVGQTVFPTVGSSNRSSDRPITPVSISTTDGVVAPCGGHCRAFERFCHYFLLVMFVIGILTGVCLVMAGYILHGQKRGGDLLVLVYIGALAAIVSTLLLSIQCSVQRDARRRKRKRVSMMMARSRVSNEVPLCDLRVASYSRDQRNTTTAYPHLSHTNGNPDVPSCCEMPLMHGSATESQIRSYDEMSQSQNGIPWWRREETQVTFKYGNIV